MAPPPLLGPANAFCQKYRILSVFGLATITLFMVANFGNRFPCSTASPPMAVTILLGFKWDGRDNSPEQGGAKATE